MSSFSLFVSSKLSLSLFLRFPGGTKTLKQLLLYMYGGVVEVQTKDAFALLSGGMQLLVKGTLIPKTKALLILYLKQHRMIDPILFLRQMLESNLLDDELLDGCAVVIADELERLWKVQDDSFINALNETDSSSMLSFGSVDDMTDESEKEETMATTPTTMTTENLEEKQERGFAIWAWLGLPYPAAYGILKKLRTPELLSKCAWKYLCEALSTGGVAPELSTTQSSDAMQVGEALTTQQQPTRIEADLHDGLRCSEIDTLMKMTKGGSPSIEGIFFILVHALKFDAKPLIEFCIAGIAKLFDAKRRSEGKEKERGKGKEKEKEREDVEGSDSFEVIETPFFVQLAKLGSLHGKAVIHPIVCEVLKQNCLAVRSEYEVFHFVLRYQELASTLFGPSETGLTEEDRIQLWDTFRGHLADERTWKEIEGNDAVPRNVLEAKEANLNKLLNQQVQTLHVMSAVRSVFGLRDHMRM